MKRRSKLSSAQKKRGWLTFLLFMAGLSATIFCVGFVTFAQKVDRLRAPGTAPNADGIVVWTGYGGGRLETGGALLKAGKGERLLISGVNPKNNLEDITELVRVDSKTAKCCIDLDYLATDTIGNARETSSWAQALGYEHIILVTSAYHMPRAQLEISAVSGRMKITAYPVIRSEAGRWFNVGARFKQLFQEYGKLVLAYLRDPASQDNQGAPLLSTPNLGDAPVEAP